MDNNTKGLWMKYSLHGLKPIGPECCLLGLATGHEQEEKERSPMMIPGPCILFNHKHGQSPLMAEEDAWPQQRTLLHRQIQIL